LQDANIPMWVIKTKGQTHQVNHVECNVPFSTKETPDNPSTKGSIKFKNVDVIIDENNHAVIAQRQSKAP